MRSRSEWLEAGMSILHELRDALAPFGIALAPDLGVIADPHPCPGYLHDQRVIAFCPPVVEGAVDGVRWLFFCRMMGCASLEEAAEFYEVALPVIICHEAAHHLRMSRAIASPSHFIEEQVCDRLAVAMVESIAAHRATLAPLRAVCERMIGRLAGSFGESPGAAFVPDVGALLVATEQLERADLERLERLAAQNEIQLDELLALTVPASAPHGAAIARERARHLVDTHYTENPAQYWHLGLTWLQSYLARSSRPSLADILQEHLLAHEDERRANDVEGALRVMLAIPEQRAGAAEGLLALRGDAVVREIVEHAREADDVLEALVRMWPRTGDWDGSAVSVLLGTTTSALRARLLLRLAGKCGLAPRMPAPGVTSEALTVELAAVDRTVDAAVITAILADPASVTPLLEAWEAHGRGLGELPQDALATLSPRTLAPRARRAFLRLALGLDRAHPAFELAATLAIEELADPLGPAAEEAEANLVAHAIVDRLDPDRAAKLAVRALPARGGAAWDQFLALFAVGGRGLPAVDEHDPLEGRLRAAAARADLRSEPTANDRTVGELAQLLIEHAERLLAYCASLCGDRAAPLGAALAAEVLVMAARGATLEVVRALAPANARRTIANVAGEASRRGSVDGVLCDILSAATPAQLRERVARLLDGLRADLPLADGSPELDPTAAPEALPALAIAALAPTKETMLTIEKLVQLRTVPLFAGVSLEQLHDVAALAVVQEYKRDASIFCEGDVGDRLYLVLAGHVAIEKQTDEHTVTLDRLGPASCFGEMALFDGTARSAGARALTDCRLLTISSTTIARIGRADPQVYEGFLRVLSQRLRVANAEVARRVTAPASLV